MKVYRITVSDAEGIWLTTEPKTMRLSEALEMSNRVKMGFPNHKVVLWDMGKSLGEIVTRL